MADLDVECYDTKHWAWMMGVGMFRMLAYVIAIPATAFYVMWRVRWVCGAGEDTRVVTRFGVRVCCALCLQDRDNLDDESVRNKFGFLYLGFNRNW